MQTWTAHNGYTISRIISGRSNVFLIDNGASTGSRFLLVDTSWKQAWGKLQSTLDRLA